MFKKESTVKFWQVFFYTNTWFGYLVTLVIQHIYTITGNAKKKTHEKCKPIKFISSNYYTLFSSKNHILGISNILFSFRAHLIEFQELKCIPKQKTNKNLLLLPPQKSLRTTSIPHLKQNQINETIQFPHQRPVSKIIPPSSIGYELQLYPNYFNYYDLRFSKMQEYCIELLLLRKAKKITGKHMNLSIVVIFKASLDQPYLLQEVSRKTNV